MLTNINTCIIFLVQSDKYIYIKVTIYISFHIADLINMLWKNKISHSKEKKGTLQ